MIISNLTGGLGNQMFQYATGRALALKNGTILKLDISSYANDKFGRHFSLDNFNIKATLATPDEIKKLKPIDNFIIQKSPRLFRLVSNIKKTYVNEKFCGENIPNNVGDLYLDGNWPSERFFVDFKYQIIQDFKPRLQPNKNVSEYLKRIKTTNSVAVHIRRGDFVRITRIGNAVGICGIEYYLRAIKFITKKIKKPVFYIFSEPDGLKWAKEKMKINYPCVLINNEDYEDMYLMSSCKHNIVANSSFSWWGAWLNENPKKIVVAPDPWFNHRKTDNVPHDWFKVPKEA